MKYETLCNDILKQIDRDNIKDVFHCVTRLRLILKDRNAVDKEALSKIDGIIQVKETGDQLQLVIGPHVADVYDEFCDIAHLDKNEMIDEKEENVSTDIPKKRKVRVTNVFEHLSAIFMPLIPAFCACGMIKCITLLLTVSGFLSETDGIITTWNMIGDVPFYFLPFFVGYTTAKRFKLNEIYGLIIAGCLLSPTLLNQTAGAEIHFLFFDIPCYSYTSTVLPVLLSVICFSYLYRAVDRLIPKSLSLVLTGTIALCIFMPLILFIIAPLGNYASVYATRTVSFLFNTSGPLAGALLAGLKPFITMAGGLGIGPMMLVNFDVLGYDFLFPAYFVNNIAVAGATIAAAFRIKNSALKSAAFSAGGLGIIGITEPALYGIDIKYKTALTGACIGGAVGGAIYMLLDVKCYLFAMPGIFSLPAYIDGGNNLMFMIISIIATFITSFAYTFIFMKDKA